MLYKNLIRKVYEYMVLLVKVKQIISIYVIILITRERFS